VPEGVQGATVKPPAVPLTKWCKGAPSLHEIRFCLFPRALLLRVEESALGEPSPLLRMKVSFHEKLSRGLSDRPLDSFGAPSDADEFYRQVLQKVWCGEAPSPMKAFTLPMKAFTPFPDSFPVKKSVLY